MFYLKPPPFVKRKVNRGCRPVSVSARPARARPHHPTPEAISVDQSQEERQGGVICFSSVCPNFCKIQQSENIFWKGKKCS